MPVPFTYVARGKDDRGNDFFTDGKLILTGQLLALATMPSPSADGVRELGPENFRQIFHQIPRVYTPLSSLQSGERCSRTADQVALGLGYVDILRALPGTLQFGTTTPTAPVWLILDSTLVGALMPLNAEPEKDHLPLTHVPGVAWSNDVALGAAQSNDLFGEYDGGSFSRLHNKVSPRSLQQLSGHWPIDAATLRAMVLSHYGVATPAACRFRVFTMPDNLPPAELEAAVERFAAAIGAKPPRAETPLETLSDVATHLQLGLALANSPDPLWVVNGVAPFLIVRRDVTKVGPFATADIWEWRTGQPYLSSVGDALMGQGVTKVQSVDHMEFPATRLAPAAKVHVIQRFIAGEPEAYVYLVTDGFRQAPLGAVGNRGIERFELMTIVHEATDQAMTALAVLGRLMHHITAMEDAAPIQLGHSLQLEEPLCGSTTFYISPGVFTMPTEAMKLMETDDAGEITFARVTPLTQEERAALRGKEIGVSAGAGFVMGLENADFADVLTRWST
ncbi:MAG TPA: hypothetical protein VGM90_15870 [Kofleriaceae bacterium]|jgi:hypothetical protein